MTPVASSYLKPVNINKSLKNQLSIYIEGTYQNIDLTIENILRFLKIVTRGSFRSSLDLIEPRSEVCRGFSLGADGVEVGSGCVLALREGDELVAGAFDDGKRNDVA